MFTSKFEKIIYWITEKLSFYNCKINRHRWVYLLCKEGIIYSDDKSVPKDQWICSKCKIKRYL